MRLTASRAGRTTALLLALVWGSLTPAHAEPPLAGITWDDSSVVAESGVATTVSGTVRRGADSSAAFSVVVERKVAGGWTAVATTVDGLAFHAAVAGEVQTYRAVLTDGATVATSALLKVSVVAARSRLTLAMPSSVRDRATVPVRVGWRRSADGVPLDGRVQLQLQRRGLSAWRTYRSIDVVDGRASVTITPRDDGRFRLRWPGDADLAAKASDPQSFDNVPVRAVTLRLGQYNLPGADKLPRASDRATKAAASIRAADLDAVVLNELVGSTADGPTRRPSSFARTVLARLGSAWRLVTPTRAYNENYVVYRPDRLRVVVQHADRIVPQVGKGKARKSTGRHVTPVLFKDLSSNQPVLVAGTHLVNGNRPGAREQAYSVGRVAHTLADGYPVVVAGDMNTSDVLKGLTGKGLKDARRAAAERLHADYSTYVRYSRTSPRTVAADIIDQVYVPRSWTVSRWTTVLGAREGRFTAPRASDHLLVWASLVGDRP